MSTYATAAQVRDELADIGRGPRGVNLPADDAVLERVIARAEQDVDSVVGGPYAIDAERKLDPATLTDPQRAALVRATAAQVAFRLRQGEFSLIGDGTGLASAGDLTFSRDPLPRVSPQVAEQLAGRGLIRESRTVSAESNDPATATPTQEPAPCPPPARPRPTPASPPPCAPPSSASPPSTTAPSARRSASR